jgi:glycosyltransferase involved in cell wall biosynthesis
VSAKVVWLPRLDYADLPLLYSAATALVFPSLFEGGGIPVIEAMACGCPVAASTIPAVQEFAGNAALLFDPERDAGIKAAMETLQSDEALRRQLIQKGICRARDFLPALVVKNLTAAYARVMCPTL